MKWDLKQKEGRRDWDLNPDAQRPGSHENPFTFKRFSKGFVRDRCNTRLGDPGITKTNHNNIYKHTQIQKKNG